MNNFYNGIIKKYHKYLPLDEKYIVSLNEGNTPLLKSKRLREYLKLPCELYFKYEGLNPTGSFKDRGMTYAISKAHAQGSQAIICASTGNTSAAAAAYAARAGMKSVVMIPKGKIAFGKLSQAIRHGAKVVQVSGNFDDALQAVLHIVKHYPITLVNSLNPDRLQGQMTAAFEIVEALGDAPDFHFIPVGNAGNITAYWNGYKIYHQEKKSKTQPKMMGFQASGAAPIVKNKIIKNPETIATAICIGNPANWKNAQIAQQQSAGLIGAVTDKQILQAYDLLAKYEGYFCEPASAASVAGVIKMAKENLFQPGQKVVCTLTGHGLKDPDTAIANSIKPVTVSKDIKEIVKVVFGKSA